MLVPVWRMGSPVKLTARRVHRETIPDWWHGVLALQRKVRRAEAALAHARQDRDLAVWLILESGAASPNWLASHFGMARPPLLRLGDKGREIARRRGMTRDEVAHHLNLASRAQVQAARLSAEEERRRWLEDWSPPPPPKRRGPAPRVLPEVPLASDAPPG